jgi:hypothetical protein
MKEVGASEGIAFALDRIERTPNTLDAHRLIWLADEQGVQDAVVETLFRAYFCEARNISDRETLLDVVAGAGLSRGRAQEVLDSGEGLDAIRAEEERARQLGVQGVPFFLINGEPAVSGAQKPEVFRAAFEQRIATATSGGNACGVRREQSRPVESLSPNREVSGRLPLLPSGVASLSKGRLWRSVGTGSHLGHGDRAELPDQPGDHDTEVCRPRPAAVVAEVHPVRLGHDRRRRPLVGGLPAPEADLLLVRRRHLAGGRQASEECGHPLGVGGREPQLVLDSHS